MHVIIDYTLGNFGPFRDDVTLSLEATKLSEHPENIIRSEDGKDDLLSSAIIFGPNAAGKSFLVDGLLALNRVVSSRGGDDTLDRAYVPYKVSKECRDAPVRLGIRLLIDGIRYDYRVEYTDREIVAESLHYYPNSRRAKIFERDGPASFPKAKKKVADLTASDTTYLTMASIGKDQDCSRVRDAITGMVFAASDSDVLIEDTCRMCDEDPEMRAMLIRALQTADLGIDDFSYKERQIALADVKNVLPPNVYEDLRMGSDSISAMDVYVKHGFKDADDEGRTIQIDSESSGTRCMFGLMGMLIPVIRNGGVLVIDELGGHLHSRLTRWVVQMFASYNNGSGAQLIANTHDLGLMDIDELLRRDQIWFVNKNRDNGSSELYCLSDFEGVRKDTDVLKAYLNGRYDAMPVVLHRGVLP